VASSPHRTGAGMPNSSPGVADIAADVGYESEAAIHRAFKREFGAPPARYRCEAKTPAKEPDRGVLISRNHS